MSTLEGWQKSYMLLMVVEEGNEWTVGSWLVVGSC